MVPRWIWPAIIAALSLACGDNAPPISPSPQPRGTYTSAHFRFEYPAADQSHIVQTAARLEQDYDRVLLDLSVPSMPVVVVALYSSHADMVAGAGPNVGVVPPWATGLVSAVDRIHLLAPGAAGPTPRLISDLVHECAHCVSIRLNRSSPNNPRWLWEAVAIYESGQHVDPRSLSYMTAQRPPAFAQLNTFDNALVYEVGYTIAEFVVDRWGAPALRDLVVANGDTQRVLQRPLPTFEAEWYAFVRQKYGF
jgi:hypothetical protein